MARRGFYNDEDDTEPYALDGESASGSERSSVSRSRSLGRSRGLSRNRSPSRSRDRSRSPVRSRDRGRNGRAQRDRSPAPPRSVVRLPPTLDSSASGQPSSHASLAESVAETVMQNLKEQIAGRRFAERKRSQNSEAVKEVEALRAT